MLGAFWTFANILSISRVLFSAAAAVIILRDGPVNWSLALLTTAVLTDWLDGQVARRTNTVSEWGKILDPAADKISAALVGIALVLNDLIPLWFIGVVLLRDLLIVVGEIALARYSGRIQMSNFPGKLAVTAIAITFFMGLMRADQMVMDICIWVTVGLLGFSLLIYSSRLASMHNNSA
ncbi:MAG: CDP-alcohol phosphatidyltransferase family protein [Bacteroidetes bacterium]|nr:CDP-alcohol phosphatidyltransferase family protein [Bacteroidota bacterium]